MDPPLVSAGERAYTLEGVRDGVRADGRGAVGLRPVSLDAGLLPHCFGSARCVVGAGTSASATGGATEAVCGIKAEVRKPRAAAPGRGWVEAGVEIGGALLAAHGGSERRAAREAETRLTAALQAALDGAVDGALGIADGAFCWVLQVDVTLLADDGGALAAVSLAAALALRDCRLPPVTHLPGEAGFDDDFEVDGALDAAVPLAGAADAVPVCVAVSALGGALVADCTPDEAACAEAALSFAVDRKGRVAAVVDKRGAAMRVGALEKALAVAGRVAAAWHRGLDGAVAASGAAGGSADAPARRLGFLAE